MMGIVVQKATELNTQLTLCTVYIILNTSIMYPYHSFV